MTTATEITNSELVTRNDAPVVLARRPSGHPSAVWEARSSTDRQRLEVVLVTQPSDTAIVVPILTSVELQSLLAEAPAEQAESWSCRECLAINPASRRWCSRCSSHIGGDP